MLDPRYYDDLWKIINGRSPDAATDCFLALIKHFDKSLLIVEMKTVYCDIFDKNALFYLTLHFIYDIII